jgi:hypothetical protein
MQLEVREHLQFHPAELTEEVEAVHYATRFHRNSANVTTEARKILQREL